MVGAILTQQTAWRNVELSIKNLKSKGLLEIEALAYAPVGTIEKCVRPSGFYKQKEYDLAGFAVGIVDNNKIVDGSEIHVGHQVIGFASSGLHSNGYSLVRKICFDNLKLKIDSHVPELGKTIGEELLTPTIIYSETILHLIRDLPVRGLVHVTGGGYRKT